MKTKTRTMRMSDYAEGTLLRLKLKALAGSICFTVTIADVSRSILPWNGFTLKTGRLGRALPRRI